MSTDEEKTNSLFHMMQSALKTNKDLHIKLDLATQCLQGIERHNRAMGCPSSKDWNALVDEVKQTLLILTGKEKR